jgi:hypothetical protein
MTDAVTTEVLEQRAQAQRQRLHSTVTQLCSSVCERMDIENAARQHIWKISAGAAIMALLLGYGAAGLFTD